MQLELTALAASDYDSIVDYSISEFGYEVASAYADAIERALGKLEDHPSSGRMETALHPDIRSVGCKSHRIYYSIDNQLIIVRRILHKATDAGNWLG